MKPIQKANFLPLSELDAFCFHWRPIYQYQKPWVKHPTKTCFGYNVRGGEGRGGEGRGAGSPVIIACMSNQCPGNSRVAKSGMETLNARFPFFCGWISVAKKLRSDWAFSNFLLLLLLLHLVLLFLLPRTTTSMFIFLFILSWPARVWSLKSIL